MKDLKPTTVWAYFGEILEIPRLSKNEERIIDYLAQFAQEYNLAYKKDKAGNVLISKAATAGFENRQTVVLQSHMDMVGEKLLEVQHDFSTDPIKAVRKGDWIYAEGTTLGADDGIGVAASMAILASSEINHGPLECLFTVDEETGMTGAFGIEEGFMTGKILLNLDSEDEGELYIGCAGGIDTLARFKKKLIPVAEGSTACKITLEGLQGGHSGDEIHKGFGNSIQMISRVLTELELSFNVSIAYVSGGKLRNAIPREAEAIIVCNEAGIEKISHLIDEQYKKLASEYKEVEPSLKISSEEVDLPQMCFERSFQDDILKVLAECPHGVIGWSRDIEGLVETSTNLAVLRDTPEYVEIVTSQRSSSEPAKRQIAERIENLFASADGEVWHSDGYPGWKPNRDSVILNIAEKTYRDLFDKTAAVKAIHAGLECGLFLKKYPDLDMISFGPTIKGAHTPEERIEIESVQKFWDFLLALLENTPE